MPTPKKRKRATGMGDAVLKREGEMYACDPAGYDPDVRHERYKKVCRKIKSWEARQSRAQTALDKLRKTRAYYEKLAGA